jgi:hypothetical protein
MQQYRTAEIKAQMEHQKQLLQQHITLHTQLAEGF